MRAEISRLAGRAEAGRLLAQRLLAYANSPDAAVLALPRGGVPVGYEIAHALHLPLDVLTVRKIGVPEHPELAMGALAADGSYVVNRDVMETLHVSSDRFLAVFQNELQEARRREMRYRDGLPPVDLSGKHAILVDDGLATGSTMYAAIDAARRAGAVKIVVAVPVAPREERRALERAADEVVCIMSPEPFYAVGMHYRDFTQITDDEVRALLGKAAAEYKTA